MSKVRFELDNYGNGEDYYCCCRGPCHKDHSGDYYPAAKVRALVAKLENDWDSDWPMPPCVLEFLHALAALEAEDENS